MIIIKTSTMQFKNPQIGQPTRAIEEHYNGRRVEALVNGEEQMFRFKKDELAFDADEEAIELAIRDKIAED